MRFVTDIKQVIHFKLKPGDCRDNTVPKACIAAEIAIAIDVRDMSKLLP